MHFSSPLVSSALALALAVAASTPAGAQTAQAEIRIDVATHTMMPGAPGMGAIGRLAGAMGNDSNASYGMTRHPGMPGKYMDVALHNRRQPGIPASQDVPRGLRLGDSIDLLPPTRGPSRPDGAASPVDTQNLADGGPYTIHYYWGCGERVRASQPTKFTMTIRNGKPVRSGRAMAPRQVPRHGIDSGPEYALWPNPSNRKSVSTKASLVGTHRVTGGGLADAIQFDLGRDHDFLSELKLENDGSAEQGMALRWNGVEGARAYFIHATAMNGNTIVMWSSAEDGYAGPELIDFLPETLVAQWTKKRTLLGAGARSCKVPREVFAGGGMPMVQMIAYGNDRVIVQPGWNVRVRSKSTAMLMPGLGAAGTDSARKAAKPAAKDAARNATKGLLRGLIGG